MKNRRKKLVLVLVALIVLLVLAFGAAAPTFAAHMAEPQGTVQLGLLANPSGSSGSSAG